MKKHHVALLFLILSGLICAQAQNGDFKSATKQETVDWILNTTIHLGETAEIAGSSTCSRKGNTLIRTWMVGGDSVRDEFDFNKFTGFIETTIPGGHFFLYCVGNGHKSGNNTSNNAMEFDIRGNDANRRQFAKAFEHLASLAAKKNKIIYMLKTLFVQNGGASDVIINNLFSWLNAKPDS